MPTGLSTSGNVSGGGSTTVAAGPSALAQSAVDIALRDLKARRLGQPLWTLLGGHDSKVPCYAGGIDLHLSIEQLRRQTDDSLRKAFASSK